LIELYHQYRTWGGYKYQKEIQNWIKAEGIQLVHTSTILTPEGAIAAKALDIPHIWHVRELIGPDKHFRFANYKRWASFVQKHSDILVANSAATYDCLKPYFPEALLTVIPNAIKASQFEQKKHVAKSPVVVGMIGSVTSKWKNHRFFIEVASEFKDNPKVKFEIYGRLPAEDDPYLLGLRKQIQEAGLSTNNFEFAGFIAPTEITKKIDILFHPTELESFGRIFVEAMASGLPVIGINEGGAMEMVQDAVSGFLVPKLDTPKVVEKIQSLADQPNLRNQMGAAGRQLALTQYDLPILAKRLKSLYDKVLANRQQSTKLVSLES